MHAVNVVRSRTSASGVDFEVLANCLVRQQSGVVTQVQPVKTHRDTSGLTYSQEATTVTCNMPANLLHCC